MKKLSDMLPNVTDKAQRKRGGTPVMREIIPAPAPEPVETMRVRILRTIRGSRSGTFIAGQSAMLPTATALSWIQMGLACEDKMLEGAPETK